MEVWSVESGDISVRVLLVLLITAEYSSPTASLPHYVRRILQVQQLENVLQEEENTTLLTTDGEDISGKDYWSRMLEYDSQQQKLYVNPLVLLDVGSSKHVIKIELFANDGTVKPLFCNEQASNPTNDIFLKHNEVFFRKDDRKDRKQQEYETIMFPHVSSGYYCLHFLACTFYRPPNVCIANRKTKWSTVQEFWSKDRAKSPRADKWNASVAVQADGKSSLVMRFTPMNINFTYYKIDLIEVQEDGVLSFYCSGRLIQRENYTLKNIHPQELLFDDLNPGNYCFRIRPQDFRCINENTFWKPQDQCILFTKKYELSVPSGNPIVQEFAEMPSVVTEINETIFIIIGIVLGVAVIIALLIVIYIHYKVKNRISTETEMKKLEDSAENVHRLLQKMPKRQVLLLYSWGAPAFQDLMVQFRKFLETACHCQVHDCFDEYQSEYISLDPSAWLMEKISCEDMKIIVVATEDAAMRLAARNTEQVLIYKDTHCFDNLFLRGIRAIQDEIHENDKYKCVFMVRFEDFTSEEHLLPHINPFCRFILPLHLQELFLGIHEQTVTLNNKDDIWTAYSCEKRQLQDKIDAMKQFVENNPDYIIDLFLNKTYNQ